MQEKINPASLNNHQFNTAMYEWLITSSKSFPSIFSPSHISVIKYDNLEIIAGVNRSTIICNIALVMAFLLTIIISHVVSKKMEDIRL